LIRPRNQQGSGSFAASEDFSEKNMSLQLKPVSEQVIVITGASSGIGLATAKLAAQRGAKVVLAARTREALGEAVDGIKYAGGEAIFVEADVTREADHQKIAAAAIERFGRIDTWVNNAGVGIWAMIDEISEADMRQLFEINFWGVVHGSRTAVKHLKESGGALINVGSVVSDRALPVQGIYSASKHAVKGFTDALRMELAHEGAPISVTLIKPGPIGTPMPQHVKNYHEQEAKFPPPIYAPEEVAKTILNAAETPVRDAFIGGGARALSLLSVVAPRFLDWVSARFLVPGQFGTKATTPTNNVDGGQSEAKVRGDHQGSAIRPSLYTKAARHPAITLTAAGATAAGVGLFLWSRGASRQDERAAPAEQSTEAEVEAHPS
jgi:NAD(P)-dependent dehydrogenase (short-subunit alcohol dehydrogenase family)